MNPYFWFFAVYAFLITPVTVHAGVRIDHGIRWRIRLLVAGVPVMRKNKAEESEKKMEAKTLAQSLSSPKRGLITALIRDGTFKRLLMAFRLERLHVQARLSFSDASATAISYTLIRTVMEILHRCGALPPKITGYIGADFNAQGTEMELQGIFSARLGKVAFAGVRLGISALRHRAELATEEKQYAASH
ncbi:MAG: hypothetical protein J6K55_14850 [Clostridia bacterium]|nr:hypothetical protein [Clostridia bacterium]